MDRTCVQMYVDKIISNIHLRNLKLKSQPRFMLLKTKRTSWKKQNPAPYKKLKLQSKLLTTITKQSALSHFVFGSASFMPLSQMVLTSLFLIRFVLFFKRITKKKDKTLRRFWLTPKSFLKITKQSKGARMGKGKGKHFYLIQRIRPLSHFIEFKTVRTGRLRLYVRKLNSRMPVRFILNTTNLTKSKNIFTFLK